jgi:hypothetical protein
MTMAKAKKERGESKITRAVEFMRDELKKAGGEKEIEQGWRKELFERAAKKFDLAPVTCAHQWHRQVINDHGVGGNWAGKDKPKKKAKVKAAGKKKAASRKKKAPVSEAPAEDNAAAA